MFKSLESLHPSGEEVQVMTKLWDEHSQHTTRLKLDISGFEMYMNTPKPYPLPDLPPFQSTSAPPPQRYRKAPPQPQSPSLPTPADVTSGAGTTPAVASSPTDGPIPAVDTPLSTPPVPVTSIGAGDGEPSPPLAVARPARFAFLRRLFSCINLKYFS
ncbi:hypothetical protein P691DRAFT_460857 [Macrolepiota fuliginosa MF-IS2]|uniref:Uncharacterized protein n=1 Tax=Macrolepiota fuliginosa MF-IS2 TaxID=1400762 RepID=A0A9P6BX72_9AGAR|nr:hypothetical protein P691DRAFT_460857 [Macrolepiota fuliginosa MF-IS2]